MKRTVPPRRNSSFFVCNRDGTKTWYSFHRRKNGQRTLVSGGRTRRFLTNAEIDAMCAFGQKPKEPPQRKSAAVAIFPKKRKDGASDQ